MDVDELIQLKLFMSTNGLKAPRVARLVYGIHKSTMRMVWNNQNTGQYKIK